jgi:hypothetical protein
MTIFERLAPSERARQLANRGQSVSRSLSGLMRTINRAMQKLWRS